MSAPNRQLVEEARKFVLDLLTQAVQKAAQAESDADLDRAALKARIARSVERGVREETCFGWSRKQAIADADWKWEDARRKFRVAEIALALATSGVADTVAAMFQEHDEPDESGGDGTEEGTEEAERDGEKGHSLSDDSS